MAGRRDPPVSVQRHPAAAHNAVQVIMIQQGLAPGVQHGGDSQLRLQASPAKLQQRLAGGIEQQREQRLAILSDQGIERVRQREHQMKIRDREQG